MSIIKILTVVLSLVAFATSAYAQFDDSTSDSTLRTMPPLHGIICKKNLSVRYQLAEISRNPQKPSAHGSCVEGTFAFTVLASLPPANFGGIPSLLLVHYVKVTNVDSIDHGSFYASLFAGSNEPFEAFFIETLDLLESIIAVERVPDPHGRLKFEPTRVYGK